MLRTKKVVWRNATSQLSQRESEDGIVKSGEETTAGEVQVTAYLLQGSGDII